MTYTYCNGYISNNILKTSSKHLYIRLAALWQHYKFFTFMALQCLFAALPATAQCPTNLIHHYSFDETKSGTYTDYVSPVTASCTDCPAPVASMFAGAQKFDGKNDGIVITDVERFQWPINVDFTIEMWVQVSGTSSASRVMMGRVATDSRMDWWVGVDPEGYAVFELYDKNRVGFKIEKMGKKINDGKWHHLVVMRNGGHQKNKLYIDGYKVADFKYTYQTDFTSVAPVTIGYYKLDHGYHFAGAIDEVMLYNKALDENEVRSRYNYGASAYCGTKELPPVITSEPRPFAVAQQPYFYDVQAIGNPAPAYALVEAPQGMRINAATGEIEWTPATTGKYKVVVKVSNSVGEASQSFEISVKNGMGESAGMRHHWMLHEISGERYKDFYTPYDAISTPEAKPQPIAGVISGGQRFDGKVTGLDVSNSSNFNWEPDESFTIEFWMRTESTTSGNRVMVGRNASDSDLHWWIGADGGGTAIFHLRNYMWDGVEIAGGPKLTDGKWHQVVAVRDGGAGANRLYVDGARVAEAGFTYRYGFQSLSPVTIGYMNREGGYRYEGDLDEVKLFGRALSDAEIQQRYQKVYDAIVELVKFEGRYERGTVVLDWETQTELELASFVIERSEDGETFTEIGTVQANGTSSETIAYTFTDNDPIKGVGYYRLRIVKENGAFTYSNIVMVTYRGATSSLFYVYPNPVHSGEVTVNITNLVPEEHVVYMLSSMAGKRITTQQLQVGADGNLDFKIQIPDELSSGIYVISVVSGTKTISRKLVLVD